MRVLMFVPGGVHRSGREKVIPAILALLKRLASRHQVTVVSLRQESDPCEYDLHGAKIINLGFAKRAVPGLDFLCRYKMLCRIVDERRLAFDVIHSFWLGQTSTMAIWMARRLRIPAIVSPWGGELVGLADIGYGAGLSWRGRRHAQLALRRAQAVTAGSRYALAQIRPFRQDAVYAPIFPDTEIFKPLDSTADDRPTRLLTVSSVNRVKDPPTLLHALKLVAEKYPDIRLDWVGFDTLAGEAAALSASLGLTSLVRFHGLHEYSRLAKFFHEADIYVQASRHEAQGVAVCEAASTGLPIVGTNVGILAELAPHAAIAVPVKDPPSLARAVMTLLECRKTRSRLSTSAADWAAGRTADWTADRFEQLYTRLSARPAELGPREIPRCEFLDAM